MQYHFRKANNYRNSPTLDHSSTSHCSSKSGWKQPMARWLSNPEVILNDIKNAGYVLLEDEEIVGYVALLINDEPEYANIEGNG
jgi:hypothetical protein